tara:strand:- start:33 stop:341 length:309 start_codon:yes stop_codon:yes gene_type:complete
MIVHKNITSEGIVTLIPKATSNPGRTGMIKKITISNNSTSNAAIVSVQIFDGSSTGYNYIGNMTIPAGVTLVLDDNVSFDSYLYLLRMEVTGTSPILDVIIK